jgi:hypothetical protein
VIENLILELELQVCMIIFSFHRASGIQGTLFGVRGKISRRNIISNFPVGSTLHHGEAVSTNLLITLIDYDYDIDYDIKLTVVVYFSHFLITKHSMVLKLNELIYY